MQQFIVDPVNVEEFLEVYKGVLPDYGVKRLITVRFSLLFNLKKMFFLQAMVAELQSGPCIAMEIKHKDKSVDVPVEFRKLCGPMDPVKFFFLFCYPNFYPKNIHL